MHLMLCIRRCFFKKRMTKFEDPSFSGYAVVRILKALLKLMTAIIIHFSLALKLTSKMFLMLLFWKNTAASLGEMRASCRDVTIALKKTSHFSLNNFLENLWHASLKRGHTQFTNSTLKKHKSQQKIARL